jgi:GAF domain-containing protein
VDRWDLSLNDAARAPDRDDGEQVIGAVLAHLWDVLENGEHLADVLQRLTGIAARLFPSGYEASIMIVATDEEPETVAVTDPEVLRLDRAQYESGTGPCLEAARIRSPVRTDLEGARERWPQFAKTAEEMGVYGYLSAPIVNGRGVIGSFNLYSRTEESFDAIDAALLTLFTNAALAAVANAERYRTARNLADELRTALETRADIDHALGILMAKHRVTAAEAWTLLSRQSQNRNVKVRELADQIIASALAGD